MPDTVGFRHEGYGENPPSWFSLIPSPGTEEGIRGGEDTAAYLAFGGPGFGVTSMTAPHANHNAATSANDTT